MTNRKTDPNTLSVKGVFAALALGSVLAGLAIYLLQAQLGIPAETARFIAATFILVGIADALVLYLWDRIFKRGD